MRRGRITKQGRGCCVGRPSKPPVPCATPQIASIKAAVGARRGRNIGHVAAARHLLTLVYYGLRDGEIRCLAHRRGGVRVGRASARGRTIGMTPDSAGSPSD